MAQLVGFLSLLWENWIEFLAPMVMHIWTVNQQIEESLSLSVSIQ